MINKLIVKIWVKCQYIKFWIMNPTKAWIWFRLKNKGKQVMNGLLAVLYIVGGMFGMMLSFYLLLLFIQWIADVVDEKRWQDWRYWFDG